MDGRPVLLMCCLMVAAGGPVLAEVPATKPQRAFIGVDQANVYSGPGRNFYRTDRLCFGTEVEIHGYEAGGFVSVRPPEGSFSWVAAGDMIVSEDGLAESAAKNVPVRVGSRFTDAKDVIQVRLDHGELVEWLDRGEPGVSMSGESFLRVSPPSGEFRYVHAADLTVRELDTALSAEQLAPHSLATLLADTFEAARRSELPPEEPPAMQSLANASDARAARASRFESETDEATSDEEKERRLRASVGRLSSNRTRLPGDDEETADSELEYATYAEEPAAEIDPMDDEYAVEDEPRRPRARRPARPEEEVDTNLIEDAPVRRSAARAERSRTSVPARSARTGMRDGIEQELLRLDRALSATVVHSPERWDLGRLRSEVQDVLEEADSPIERGNCWLLLDKIERFQRVQMAQRQVLAGRRRPPLSQLAYRAPPSQGPQTVMEMLQWRRPDPNAYANTIFGRGGMSAIPAPRSAPQTRYYEPGYERALASGRSQAPPRGAYAAARSNNNPNAAGRMARAPAHSRSGPARPEFSRTGQLIARRVNRATAEPYALIDDTGKTLAFIRPQPGLDMNDLVGQTVGVEGRVSRRVAGQPQYIVAEEVTPLGGRRVR